MELQLRVGTECSNHGRSCEEHKCCRKEVLEIDTVIRTQQVQIMLDGEDKVHWHAIGSVMGYIVAVGFLPHHLIKQMIDIFSHDDNIPTKRHLYHHHNKG